MTVPAIFIGLERDPCVGRWVTLDGPDLGVLSEIAKEIVNEYNTRPTNIGYPAEEFGIMGHEGFEELEQRPMSFEYAVLVGQLYHHCGDEDEFAALAGWASHHGIDDSLYSSDGKLLDAETVYSSFQDEFSGIYDDESDYVQSFWEDTGCLNGVPVSIQQQIFSNMDWDRVWYDCKCRGSFSVEVSRGAAIFT